MWLLEHQFYILYLNILFSYIDSISLQAIFMWASPRVNLDRPNLNPILEWSYDLNTFLLMKRETKYPLNMKNFNAWTWLVLNNFMWFVIIKIKLSVPWGQQSLPFWWWQNTRVIKAKQNEELKKLSLKLCLSIKFNYSWLNDVAITTHVICI